MAANYPVIIGEYAIEGSRLYGITNPDIEFLVGSRRPNSAGKPQNFLLWRSPAGAYEHIAELFDVPKPPLLASQTYRFRYMGQLHRMDVYHASSFVVIALFTENTNERL
jgi:hypothetical protein